MDISEGMMESNCYFISYAWRYRDSYHEAAHWCLANRFINQEPWEWVVENKPLFGEDGFRIIFAIEVSQSAYDKWQGRFS